MNKIRFAKLEDAPRIVELCQQHALFEQTHYSTQGKADALAKAAFSAAHGPAKLVIWVVEQDNCLVG